MDPHRPRVGFVLERALGHTTHGENLKRILPQDGSIDAEVFDIDWDVSGLPARIPVFNSNWTVRSGLRTRRGIRRMHRAKPLDALFIHTQVPAVLSPDWLTRIRTVVSLDATPLQYDELGAHYDHRAGHGTVEKLKWRANRTCFQRAAHIVTWSGWAEQGVIDGYGVDAGKITVIPPGVTPSTWTAGEPKAHDGGPVRILFVGGDLRRKGGDLLIDAFHDLRASLPATAPGAELHIVTQADVLGGPGIFVHRGLGPNSAQLVALYRSSDVFCLPTRGDCLPMVLSEAGAAGLPLVSTTVAGIPEIVRDGDTGLLVPPDDRAALVRALRTLVEAPDLRARLGASARALVERDFDAEKNASRLVRLLTDVAGPRSGP